MSEILGHSPDAYAIYSYETHGRRHPGDRQGRVRRIAARSSTPWLRPKASTSLLGGTWSFTETGDTDTAIIGLNETKPNDEANSITFLEVRSAS